MVEMPSLLGSIAYYLTGWDYYFIIPAIGFLLLISNLPSRPRVAGRLGLSGAELNQINDPNAVVDEYQRSEGD